MSILNHSIPTNGQPLLPPKSSAAQDASQHLSMARSSQAAHWMKSSEPDPSARSSLVVSSRDVPRTTGSVSSEVFQNGSFESLKIPDMDLEPAAESFLCSLSENEKFVRIFDHSSSSQMNVVLSVSVSSAVKLDSRQIELIARKMQKLTGFRNLKLENIVDPSLIAGFTISYCDDESDVIDLSVKGQLASLAARVESSERIIANNAQSWSS
ncbi:uncharacterized protein A4U43_C07F10180 [Asparagus officinalis]|uniref:ATP synthase delta chain, chloroplastic n=1 Tax=Asparagus officinalis TaxID=4686 RepID=A0A5P1EB45_ASPOF|nr:ATP synthase delta chain, chloroplastic [Asparagus officinalis]ONK62983.1 uncharacterized protein A4U43_C07F10180 [Asparagus officinalis]